MEHIICWICIMVKHSLLPVAQDNFTEILMYVIKLIIDWLIDWPKYGILPRDINNNWNCGCHRLSSPCDRQNRSAIVLGGGGG